MLRSEHDRPEVQHVAIRRWQPVTSDVWWNTLVQMTHAVGAPHACEIGCEYGLQVPEAGEISYTGVDYGYFVEFARALHPARRWVKIDYDRYDAALFDRLFDPEAAYFVRARLEHVRDPDLLLSCLAGFAGRGAAVVVAHHALDEATADAELPPFFRRRLPTDAVLEAIGAHGLAARVLGQVPAPTGSHRQPLTLVGAGSPEQLDALAGVSAGERSEGQEAAEPDGDVTPESMVFDPDIPLLSRRLVRADEAPSIGTDEVFEAITRAREEARPFALVRLGNGEGRVLGFPDYIPPIWLARSMRNWFKSREPELAVRELQDEAAELIAEADVIGVLRQRYTDSQYSLPPRLLQLYGLTAPGAVLCGADVHLQALGSGFLDALLRDEPAVSLVCGHDLADAVGSAFDIPDVRQYRVPAQAKFFYDPDQEPHYPTVFERLRETIEVRRQGEVFLVGAGFLGKIYCGWIKRRGGIALDVGSVFDLWAGQHTRGSDPSVAERYSLVR